MDHYTLPRWVNLMFFANFPAREIPAAVHLLASLRLAVDTTAAYYLATTCNAAEISRIQVTMRYYLFIHFRDNSVLLWVTNLIMMALSLPDSTRGSGQLSAALRQVEPATTPVRFS